MKVDMHIHTLHGSRDGKMTLADAIVSAQACHLDGICVTEHENFISSSLVQEQVSLTKFRVFRGMEMSPLEGHFLIYCEEDTFASTTSLLSRNLLQEHIRNIQLDAELLPSEFMLPQLTALPAYRGIQEFLEQRDSTIARIRQVHQAHGVIFWAHPFEEHSALRKAFDRFLESTTVDITRMNQFLRFLEEHDPAIYEILEAIDGFETMNGSANQRGVNNSLTTRLALEMGRPGIGGSDAHSPQNIGGCFTAINPEIENLHELIEALRIGAVQASTRSI